MNRVLHQNKKNTSISRHHLAHIMVESKITRFREFDMYKLAYFNLELRTHYTFPRTLKN